MPKLLKIVPVLMSHDIGRSIKFFRSLGFESSFVDSLENPRYAAVERDGIVLHLQWHDPSEFVADLDRPTYRFLVDDVDSLAHEFRSSGRKHMSGPMRTAWGTYEFHVQDEDRNGLQFYDPLEDCDETPKR